MDQLEPAKAAPETTAPTAQRTAFTPAADSPATTDTASEGGEETRRPDLGRRHHARSHVEIAVEYALVDEFVSEYTRNISKGGIFIRSDRQLPLGTQIAFRLDVPGLPEPLTIMGRVAWARGPEESASEGEEPGMGIEFLFDSEEQRAGVVRAVDELVGAPDSARSEQHDSRRAHRRVPIELKVEYKDLDQFLIEYTRNISRGGVFIRSDAQLARGTKLVFHLHVPGLSAPLAIKGRVAWVRPAGYLTDGENPGMGIEFIYDTEDERAHVEETVETLIQQCQ
jgi:type IV pilus assembly protein PilZ